MNEALQGIWDLAKIVIKAIFIDYWWILAIVAVSTIITAIIKKKKK